MPMASRVDLTRCESDGLPQTWAVVGAFAEQSLVGVGLGQGYAVEGAVGRYFRTLGLVNPLPPRRSVRP